jgi:hypothetical protein
MEKQKAWLVVNGYSQVEGIEFCKTKKIVSKLTSIRFILFVANALDFEVE